MHMYTRICPVCGKPFSPKTYRHIFCHRRCFKLDYRKRMKEEHFPVFNCPNCGTKTELDFSPQKNESIWEKYKCPICGYNNLEDCIDALAALKKGLLD